MQNDYSDLDSHITEAISAGADTFCAIHTKARADGRFNHYGLRLYRAIDRRMQALRKRGVIEFNKKRWSLARPTTEAKERT
jgi:hypothetical protein